MFLFFSHAIATFREIRRQKKYVKRQVVPYLARLEQKCQGTIPAHQKRKILTYYSVLVPIILGMQFRKLRGEDFSMADRWSTSMTGLITPLFDDAFDVCREDPVLLENLVLYPETTEAVSFRTRTLKEVNSLLLKTAADPAAYQAISRSVLAIQVDSLRQFDPGISSDELERITFSKGCNSFIYYYTHLVGKPDPAVTDAFYLIGGLHQTCNDLFDMHKDLHEGQFTLANTCRDFTAFKRSFLEKIRVQNQKINALPYKQKDKKRFGLIMQSIEGKGLIAIDHFINLERIHGKGLGWSRFSRNDLVLDLETPRNYLKWMYNTWKISRMT